MTDREKRRIRHDAVVDTLLALETALEQMGRIYTGNLSPMELLEELIGRALRTASAGSDGDTCPRCKGKLRIACPSGRENCSRRCAQCGGTGYVTCPSCQCESCGGTGQIGQHTTCNVCRGSGVFRPEPPTRAQQNAIWNIEKHLSLKFEGRSKKEASAFISKHMAESKKVGNYDGRGSSATT